MSLSVLRGGGVVVSIEKGYFACGRRARLIAVTAVLVCAVFLGPNSARCDSITTIEYSGMGLSPGGTGNDVSADVKFSIDSTTNTMTVTLKNTTAASPKLAQGDTLTGLLFDFKNVFPSLKLTSTVVSPGALYYTSSGSYLNSSQAPSINGSWTNSLAYPSKGEYGVATTGYNGLFDASKITKGTGGSDYGILNSGYPLNSSSFKNHYPYIVNSITFTFTGGSKSYNSLANVTVANLSNVQFLFGTGGCGAICGSPSYQNPEPGSLALASIGVVGLIGYRRRSRKKKNAPV